MELTLSYWNLLFLEVLDLVLIQPSTNLKYVYKSIGGISGTETTSTVA